MSGALEAFRAQREAVDDLRARVDVVAKLIADVAVQVDAIAKNQTLRDVLNAERTWLAQTEQVLERVRALREDEVRRFWPAVWRRWTVALAFALAAAMASGAGFVLGRTALRGGIGEFARPSRASRLRRAASHYDDPG